MKYIRLTGHDTCTHEPYRSADTNTMIRRLDLFVLDPPQSSQSESMADLVFFCVFCFCFFWFKKFTVQSGRRPDSALNFSVKSDGRSRLYLDVVRPRASDLFAVGFNVNSLGIQWD